MKIAIIDYGAGNVKSVQFALNRLGFEGILSADPAFILNADKVIFPGVGAANAAMKKLRESGLDQIIPILKQPVLGICLGMQLLCNYSEEGNTDGLGIFDVAVKKFPADNKIPQMGWNTIHNLKSPLFDGISENEYVYLVHSFYAEKIENTIATTKYGLDYASALQKDNFFGVQFHPEKSGKTGEKILGNFLKIEL
ncbi:imidazole glycerol phosphate synthase subunit HisH [Flavobacterium macacae]|uniref:Imidazole glycerol phosphate synthase subunit HisH n=1 Tax=Flavobacterium macacae TaxID=2488993 RepID=A0A3P3W860_9FLAO|nr:imidazole glycerol phosphate synthase subunit HisH [Flavobacterium macacae]RRJ91345.1 imidazole glycerol phosphate synthase subunit HisH [Flavobacterium macacae]